MQIDILERILRLMWMLVFTIWVGSAYSSNEPVSRKGGKGSDVAVWTVSIGWVLLIIRGFSGPRLVPRIEWVRMIGFAITVAGLSFALWSRHYLGRNWDAFITLKQNHKLVQGGPYSIVRHPIYSGFMLASIATAFTFGYIRPFVAALLIVVAWLYKSSLEDSFLMDHFGAEYEQYRRQVKRLIPYVW